MADTPPSLIAACDWSLSPHKRWRVLARHSGGGWEVDAPEPAGPMEDFFPALRHAAAGPVLCGFDFPIGLPRAWAARTGVASFPALLPELGTGRWREFYEVASSAHEISLERPFYPRATGGKRKHHLTEALGVADLLRACDRATATRRRACEIFWTLGANQVGRAAIAGWRDLLAPAVRAGEVKLWPFEREPHAIVAAEIYPAETYTHIGLPPSFGKASREARRAQAPRIGAWCDERGIRLVPELRRELETGFDSDDPFDAFIGALGMIEAVDSPQPLPDDPAVTSIEGWILGAIVSCKS